MSDFDKDLDDLFDEEFDYNKEIAEIEAQEKELELMRQKKKKELEELRQKRENSKKKNTSSKKSMTKEAKKEAKKEAEWLGETFDDDVDTVDVPKKSKKGIIFLLIIILALLVGGGAFVYNKMVKEKGVSDFQNKISAFQSEKLDGKDLGVYEDYFKDFMKECQEAVDNKDLVKIAELTDQWAQVEEKYTDVSNGKTSLEAFVSGTEDKFAKYFVTSDYKDEYKELVSEIEDAEKNCEYDKITKLQKKVDALCTNLKSADLKKIQTLKNEINALDLDSAFVKNSQKDKFDAYKAEAEKAEEDGDYAAAISTLKNWRKEATALADEIAAEKAESQSKAESESREAYIEQSEKESKALEEAESRARAESESKRKESEAATTTTKTPETQPGIGTEVVGDYVISGSSSRYLSASDVQNLSSYQLMIARNEIYARHGYIFNDSSLLNYFKGKSWYNPSVSSSSFDASVLNDYEIKNIELIRSYE